MMLLQEYFEQQMKDPEFAQAYDELEPEFRLAEQLIALRLKRGLTQEQLAEKVGTKQSSISRLESASSLPSLSMVRKVATALDAQLEIRLRPTKVSHRQKAHAGV